MACKLELCCEVLQLAFRKNKSGVCKFAGALVSRQSCNVITFTPWIPIPFVAEVKNLTMEKWNILVHSTLRTDCSLTGNFL
jgi:hypothetical protein